MKNYMAVCNRFFSRKIYYDDIVFIETDKHEVVIHTMKDRISFRGNSKEMQQLVKKRKDFYLCHSYLIVNFENTECMEDGEIIFSNGEKKSIGKRNFHKTKAVFTEYMEKDE